MKFYVVFIQDLDLRLLCRFLLWNIRAQKLTARIWPLCAALGERDLYLEP